MHLPPRGANSPITRLLAGFAATALGVGLSISGAPAAHAADSYFCSDGTVPLAPVADVEAFSAGTAVTGLSVTSGTDPSEFTGTYIGYIADGLGKNKDLLLFRMHSDVIDGTGADGLKPAGIWAGMSGSPVYTTDGKLIGAVAYSLNWDNLPVAGVTPAEYMKSIGTNVIGTSSTLKITKANLKVSDAGTAVAGTTLAGASLSPVKAVNIAGPAGTRPNELTNLTLARTPKTAKGASTLRSRTFLPAAAQRTVSAPLVAGGSIAVLYTSGDLIAGAIGTVTAICGDNVYAFGHPMSQVGKTYLGMANASTAMIVPDGTGWYGSYKQVSKIGDPIGAITQDRTMGIRGTLGAVDSFPIDVAVQNASGAEVATYHADVIYPEIGASAVAALTTQAAYEQLDEWYSGTGKVTWTIDYTRADGSTGSLTNTQAVADDYYFGEYMGEYPAEDLWTISSNEFEDVTIDSVQITAQVLSDDSLTYQPSDVQVQDATGAWGSLDGLKLKAGSTYSIRPEYTMQRNGKDTTTTSTGDAVDVKLAKKARTSGSFKVRRAYGASAACEDDACADWYYGDYSSFDDLIAALEDQTSTSDVLGLLRYKRTTGSTTTTYLWDGPGVIQGSTTAYFTIKK